MQQFWTLSSEHAEDLTEKKDDFEKWKLPSSFTQKIKLLYNDRLVKEQILFSNIIGREKKKTRERCRI